MPENYNIGVTGDASQLKQEISTIDRQISNIGKDANPKILEDWKEKLKEIEKQSKTVYDTIGKFSGKASMPTKDFENMNKSAQEAVKQMNDLKEAIDNVGRSGKFDGKGVTQDMKKAYAEIYGAVNRVNESLRDTSKIKIKPDVNVKDAVREIELLNKQTQRSKDLAQSQANKKLTASRDQRDMMQVKRISNDGQRTGKISYNDRQRLNEQIGKRDDYERLSRKEQSASSRYARQRQTNTEQINKLSKDVTDPKITREREAKIRENIAKLTQENQALEKSIQASNKRSQQYSDFVNDLDSIQQTSNDYGTKAKRGSMQAMIEDRSAAFGMATVGAVGGVMGSSYMKGSNFNKESRDDMFYMGNIQGRDDYHGVRKDMFRNGIDTGLGYSGQDLLSMNKSYMSYNGYNGREDFDNGMQQYQRSGRALNIDQEAFESTFENIGMTGALEGKNGSGVESFTNTLVGALDKSKMTARSEEQVKALGDVVTTLGQTRNLSTSDLEDTVALQGSLASTGNRLLQGEKGANVMNTMTESMIARKNDSQMLSAVGYGSELTGAEGRVEAQRRVEQGATVENINAMIDRAGDNEAYQNLGLQELGLSVEEADAIIKAKNEGKLDEDYVKKMKEDSKKEGKDKADENVENVKESREGKANQADTKTEYQDSKLAEHADKILKPLQNFVGSFGTGAYIILKAATTLAASASFIAASSGAGRGVRYGADKAFGGGRPRGSRGGKSGGSTGGGAVPPRSGGARANGAQSRNRRGGNKSAVPGADNKSSGSSGIISGMPFMGGAPGGTKGSDTSGGGIGGKIKGGLGRMGGAMSGMALPMMMMGGMTGGMTGGSQDGENGGSPMGGMFSTMLQFYLMDMMLDKGIGGMRDLIGKGKDTDWKGMANKGKGKVARGRDIYRKKGMRGIGGSLANQGRKGWDAFSGNKTVGKIDSKLGKGFDKAKGFGKRGFGKLSSFGGQSPTGTMNKTLDMGRKGFGKLKDNSKIGKGLGVGTKMLKRAGWIGAGVSALDIGSSLVTGDKEGASKKFGDTVGGVVDPLGLGYGNGIKDSAKGMADRAQNSKGLFGKDGLIDFSWGNGDKDGKGGFGDSPVGKAWGGIKSLFGGGNKDSKASVGKGGGGGGSANLMENSNSSMGDLLKGTGSATQGNPFGTDPMGLRTGAGEDLANEGESGSDKAQEGEGKAKKNKAKGERQDAERLRMKNNETESKNLGIYRNLLTKAQQIINEAKSLDLSGGGDSESGDDGSASDIGGKGEEKIFKFLKSKGLSDNQAGAVMGNLYQESKLDPEAVNPSSGAFGIAQWLGGRKTGLDNFSKKQGKKSSDLDVQLDYLWKEMESGYDADMLKSAGWSDSASLEKNTHAFATGFERMGANEAMMGTRTSKAKAYAKKYGGGGKGGGGGSSALTMPELQDLSTSINSNATLGQQQNRRQGNTVTDSRTFNVNINVSGGDNARETAQQTANEFRDLLSGLDTFANEYARE